MTEHDPEMLDALKKGTELFNKKEFYEAHEVWEEKWNDAEDDDRRLLQGLIQVAAGFYKLQVGMPAGTHKLLEKGEHHLRQLDVPLYGIDLDGLLQAVEHWKNTAHSMVQSFRTDYDKNALPQISIEQLLN